MMARIEGQRTTAMIRRLVGILLLLPTATFATATLVSEPDSTSAATASAVPLLPTIRQLQQLQLQRRDGIGSSVGGVNPRRSSSASAAPPRGERGATDRHEPQMSHHPHHPQRRRRLGQDKVVATPSPTTSPTVATTKGGGGNSENDGNAMEGDDATTTTKQPVVRSSSTNRPTPVPTAAAVVAPPPPPPTTTPAASTTANPTVPVPNQDDTVDGDDEEEEHGNDNGAVALPLASFDVRVVASILESENRTEQLLLYRKFVRTALQDYLQTSLSRTFLLLEPDEAAAELTRVVLRVVETPSSNTDGSRRRQLQQQPTEDAESTTDDGGGILFVDQIFSYAGDAIFITSATSSSNSSSSNNSSNAMDATTQLQLYQGQVLAQTSDVQTALDEDGTLTDLVTIQSIRLWSDTGNGNTKNPPEDNGEDTNLMQNRVFLVILISSVIGGAVLALVLCVALGQRCCCRSNNSKDSHPPPPPLIALPMEPPLPPFSPYGKEDNDSQHDHEDVMRIVSDLESLEGSLQDGKSLSSLPYLQLTVTGSTEEGGDSIVAAVNSNTIVNANTAIAASPAHDPGFALNKGVSIKPEINSNGDGHVLQRPQQERLNETTGNNRNLHILSIINKASASQPSLYATPVIAMSGSGDSMDGYSLHSGFYGARGKPGSSLPSDVVSRTLLQDHSPSKTAAVRPSWLAPVPSITPSKLTTHQMESSEEYNSDSESQFSYGHIGAAPLQPSLSTMLGPALYTMSTDSEDAASSNVSMDDELILHLGKGGVASGILADSPTLKTKHTNFQHVYDNSGRHTPINNVHIPNQHASIAVPYRRAPTETMLALPNYSSRPTSDELMTDEDDDDEEEDALRIAVMPSSLRPNVQKSYKNTNVSSSNAAVTATTALTWSEEPSETESQPSDEMNENSMGQELDGFADELQRIKSDIRLSLSHDKSTSDRMLHGTTNPATVMTSPMVHGNEPERWSGNATTLTTATLVSPDNEESRIVSSRRR